MLVVPSPTASHFNPIFVAVRCTRVDDTYDGYSIPAGSYVVVNIW